MSLGGPGPPWGSLGSQGPNFKGLGVDLGSLFGGNFGTNFRELATKSAKKWRWSEFGVDLGKGFVGRAPGMDILGFL